jgi:hypothetical protein
MISLYLSGRPFSVSPPLDFLLLWFLVEFGHHQQAFLLRGGERRKNFEAAALSSIAFAH